MYGGSTFQGTADSWEGAKDYCTSNQVAGADSASNFCKFSQVGLYLGSSAPSAFLGQPVSTTKKQVEYYIEYYDYSTVSNEASGHTGIAIDNNSTLTSIPFHYAKRVTPAVTGSVGDTWVVEYRTSAATGSGTPWFDAIGKHSCRRGMDVAATPLTAGDAVIFRRDGTDTTFLKIEARH